MRHFAILTGALNPVQRGNILFYVFSAALVVALVIICVLFTRSKRFKIRQREKMAELKEEYVPPVTVRIADGQRAVTLVVHRLAEEDVAAKSQENASASETYSDETPEEKADSDPTPKASA